MVGSGLWKDDFSSLLCHVNDYTVYILELIKTHCVCTAMHAMGLTNVYFGR